MAPRATRSHRAMGRTPVGSRGSSGETAGPTSECRPGQVFEADERVPSGVIDVGHCGFALVVSRSTVPVPSAAWLYRFRTPARSSDLKMIRRPSGVQSGSPSMPGAKVKRLSVSRARSQIQMSVFS